MSIKKILDDAQLRSTAKQTLEYVKAILVKTFEEKGLEAEIDLRIVVAGGPFPKSVQVVANVKPVPVDEEPTEPEDDASIRGRMIELE